MMSHVKRQISAYICVMCAHLILKKGNSSFLRSQIIVLYFCPSTWDFQFTLLTLSVRSSLFLTCLIKCYTRALFSESSCWFNVILVLQCLCNESSCAHCYDAFVLFSAIVVEVQGYVVTCSCVSEVIRHLFIHILLSIYDFTVCVQEDSEKTGKVTSAGMYFLHFQVYRMDSTLNAVWY